MSDLPHTPTEAQMQTAEDYAANAARQFLEKYIAFPSAYNLDQAILVMRDYQRPWMLGRKR